MVVIITVIEVLVPSSSPSVNGSLARDFALKSSFPNAVLLGSITYGNAAPGSPKETAAKDTSVAGFLRSRHISQSISSVLFDCWDLHSVSAFVTEIVNYRGLHQGVGIHMHTHVGGGRGERKEKGERELRGASFTTSQTLKMK